jgi:hypothetical protein
VAISSSEAIFMPKRAVLTRHEAANCPASTISSRPEPGSRWLADAY